MRPRKQVGSGQTQGKDETDADKVENSVEDGRSALEGDNFIDDGLEASGHVVPGKHGFDPSSAAIAHAANLIVGEVERTQHDVGPGGDIVRGSQPASLSVDNGLNRTASVGSQHWCSGQHGLEGDNAKVLVGGRVDE